MVAFASAVAAVRCAVDMQRATTGRTTGCRSGVGLDAGEPLPDGERPLRHAGDRRRAALRRRRAGGDPRLRGGVPDRGPRVGEAIQPAGALRLRGVGERVAAAQVRWREDEDSEPRRRPPARARDHVVVRRRPAPAARRLPRDPRRRARHPRRRRGGRRARAPSTCVRRTRPDVVLMDIRMPELDGLAAAERHPRRPRARHRGAHADDVRPRRVHLRGAAHRRQRLPAQGRAGGPAARRRPRGRRRRRACSPRRSPGG